MSRRARFTLAIVLSSAALLIIQAGPLLGEASARPLVDSSRAQLPGPSQRLMVDADLDGIADTLEDTLAETFAPVVYHGEKEVAFPVTVEWWLARTHLSLYDDTRSLAESLITPGPLQQRTLIDASLLQTPASPVPSPFTRSRTKHVSLYLDNVAPEFRRGQTNPATWTTYVHSYPNIDGGITLQYWRAYTWNDARLMGVDFSHGGDWEAIAVHLNASLQPDNVSYLQHTGIAYYRDRVKWEGTHPVVYSEEGAHASAPDPRVLVSTRTIRQETWAGGHATWFDGQRRASGGLVNLGERSQPRNGQVFVRYAGLWGEPGRLFLTSGYWGPAFNETGATCTDGAPAYRFTFWYAASRTSCGRIFMKAWCDGMAPHVDRSRECYAAQETQ